MPNYLTTTLKTLVLHRGLCVSYAGSVDGGCRGIFDLHVNPDDAFDTTDVVRALKTASRTADVDYLVASLTPTPSLRRISGGMAWQVTEAFVGLRMHTPHTGPISRRLRTKQQWGACRPLSRRCSKTRRSPES